MTTTHLLSSVLIRYRLYCSWLVVASMLFGCQDDGLLPANNQVDFLPKLSQYAIYENRLQDLQPTAAYQAYDLGSSLFSDYSEKQRLIKLPAGTFLKKIDDGLPSFPDGTIIAKTFYYYEDVRKPLEGKKIVETRLLLKGMGVWNVATYLWDDDQQEARLVKDGFNKVVNFVDKNGQPQVIAYRLPSNRACASCHNVDKKLSPIGPKLRNLNLDLNTTTGWVNQLNYLQSLGLLDPFDVTAIRAVPNYHNTALPLAERARAYLDINCAHCHDAKGSSPNRNMFYSYTLSLKDTKIMEHRAAIVSNMIEGSMPQIGTSVIDQEGAALIEAYINSL